MVSDACELGSFLNTIASSISQDAFDYLDAPVVTIGAPNWITPPPELEDFYYPQKGRILDIIHERVLPLY